MYIEKVRRRNVIGSCGFFVSSRCFLATWMVYDTSSACSYTADGAFFMHEAMGCAKLNCGKGKCMSMQQYEWGKR